MPSNLHHDGIIQLCKCSKRCPGHMNFVRQEKGVPTWPLITKGSWEKVLVIPSINYQ
jgi:hypothetical protein